MLLHVVGLGLAFPNLSYAVDFYVQNTAQVAVNHVTVQYALPAEQHYSYVVQLYYERYDADGMWRARVVDGAVGSVNAGGTINWSFRADGIAAYEGIVKTLYVGVTRIRRANPVEIRVTLAGAWQWFGPEDLSHAWYDSTVARRSGAANGVGYGLPIGVDFRGLGSGDLNLGFGMAADPVTTEINWNYVDTVAGRRAFLGRAFSIPYFVHARLNWSTFESGTAYYVSYGVGVEQTWYRWARQNAPGILSSRKEVQRVEIGVDWNSSGGLCVAYAFDRQRRGVLLVGLVFRGPSGVSS